MTRRLAAASATLCILSGLGGVDPARAGAGRRPVAVVALSADPQAELFANRLGIALVEHTVLAPLEQGAMIGALVGEFVDEQRDPLASAEDNLVRAEKALGEFVFPVAISAAQAGHEALHAAVPTTRGMALYANLALVIAKARLGEAKQAEAAAFFGLVHQLTPGRRLDPTLHLPEVVDAYEAARPGVGQARTGTLVVKGSGRLWIDGKDQGATTKPIALPAGLHVVWRTGFERATVGQQVVVPPDAELAIALPEAPAAPRLKVERARLLLAGAADPAARAIAMRRLAELLGVRDAVVISRSGETASGSKLLVQTWHDRTEGELTAGFSAIRLAEGERLEDLLRPLAPPPPAAVDPLASRPLVLEKRWYQRNAVRASIAIGVVGIIAGSVMIARALADDTVSFDGGIGFGAAASGVR